MTDTNTLAPCPFCGERAETDFIPEHHSYQIACSDSIGCTARITRESELGAIEAWNCRAALAVPAQPITSDINNIMIDAIFDFMGYLTTRDELLKLSAFHEASPAVEAIEEWAEKAGLSLENARVRDWKKTSQPAAQVQDDAVAQAAADERGGTKELRVALDFLAGLHPLAAPAQPVAWALQWPDDSRLNLSTVFDTQLEATDYRESCSDGVVVVPYTAPQPPAQDAPVVAATWQPIASAPKDGKAILLRSKNGRIADGLWSAANSNVGFWAWAYVRQEPVEWMPLPLPVVSAARGAAVAKPAVPDQAGEYPAGTGNPEADRIIGRLASSDPDFDDCADAVALIHKLVAEIKGPDGFDTWKDAAIANRAARGAAWNAGMAKCKSYAQEAALAKNLGYNLADLKKAKALLSAK